MIRITYTEEQASAIVKKWNEEANNANQLDASQAHLVICGDEFDSEIEARGEAEIEVPARQSRTGLPQFITIYAAELTVEIADDA